MNKTINRSNLVLYIYFFSFITPLNLFKSQLFITTTLLLIGWLLTLRENDYMTKLKEIFNFKPFLLLIVFFIYTYTSLLWSSDLKEGWKMQGYFKYYFIIIPVLASTLTAQEAKNAFKFFIISLGSYAFISIFAFLGVITISKTPENPIGNLAYSVATPFLVVGFFSSILLAINETNNRLKYLFYFIAVVCFIGVFIHNGRAGQVAFFGTTFVFIIIYIRKLLIPKNFIIASLLVALSISSIFMLQKNERFSRGIEEINLYLTKGEFEGSWGARAYLWSGAVEGIKSNLFFGVGSGGNTDEMLKFQKKSPSKFSGILTATHNLHLDLLLKYGFFGYLLFISSIVSLILLFLKSDKNKRLYALIGIVFFSTMFFTGLGDDILTIKPFNNVFIIIFILLSAIYIENQKNNLKVIT